MIENWFQFTHSSLKLECITKWWTDATPYSDDALIVESSKILSLGIHVILTLIICYYGQFQKQNYTNNQIYGVNKVQQHQKIMLYNHIKN